jgi:hypothetical protein
MNRELFNFINKEYLDNSMSFRPANGDGGAFRRFSDKCLEQGVDIWGWAIFCRCLVETKCTNLYDFVQSQNKFIIDLFKILLNNNNLPETLRNEILCAVSFYEIKK